MKKPQPNILLITSDQQHFSTLGSVNPKIKTPALDRLAHEGARFDRAYCNNPLCTPSRSTIITGLYPSVHGAWTIGVKLPEDVPTIGGYLHDAGYRTSLFGKAHFQPLASRPDLGSTSLECQPTLRDLDFWRKFRGPWYGFDRLELGRMHTNESHAGQHYAIWLEEHGLSNWRDYFDPWPRDASWRGPPWPRVWEIPEPLHYNYWIAERTNAELEAAQRSGQPFFSWASFFDPHYPQIVPEPWYSMYRPEDMDPGTLEPGELPRMPLPHQLTQQKNPDFSRWIEGYPSHGYHRHAHGQDRKWLQQMMAVYYGMVSFTDHAVGQILARLDALGLTDNTLVVYTSDHGDYHGQHGLHAKGPFHYEDGIRVPMLARWKDGGIPAGRACTALQGLIDFAPTWLTAAGLPVPGMMQGVNQLPVWCGTAEKARDMVIVENRHQTTKLSLRTYVDERYKITVYRDETYGEIYDLQADPDERMNLWDDPASAGLRSRLLQQALNAELVREPTRMPRVAGA